MTNRVLNGKSLIGLTWSADVATAARTMVDKDIAALGVYSADAHELLGVVTERDVTRAVAEGRDPTRTRIADVMTRHPVAVEHRVTPDEAAKLMRDGHVRHLILKCDGSDRILSMRDL